MSRRKNQTVKLLKDYYRAGQFYLCTSGEVFAYDPDTAELIRDIESIAAGPPLDLCKTPTQRRKMQAEHERGKLELGTRLSSLFADAIRTGKLERVQRLAAATSMVSRGPVSPNYLWLWAYLGVHATHPDKIHNTPPPWSARVTFDQVSKEYDARFDVIEPSQLRAMIKVLGWTLAPGKPGPKVSNNSR